MLNGVIVKGIGGFYYVECNDKIYECRARGKFRLDKITPLVGDFVEIEADENTGQGYIINIIERKNMLVRPNVANVDQAIIVFSAKKPDINMALLQKFILYAEYISLDVVVCINKIDLDEEKQYQSVVKMLQSVPYKVIETSALFNIGIEELKECLKNKTSVFAGPSGAGKSSILNAVQPGLALKTGDLSKKIDRGKHTTRHVELIKLNFGGKVVDTPGFTSLDLISIQPEELQKYFPEFDKLSNCRFSSCFHINEPSCAVKDAVENGQISEIRYNFYKNFFEELKSNRRY